jgi:activator of 2-hydroxyglutaryl-CoA dehydratase
VKYFVGIDIGSTSIKIVIVDEQKQLIGYRTSASGSMFYKYAQETLDLLLKELNISNEDIAYIVSTGYGRQLLQLVNMEKSKLL